MQTEVGLVVPWSCLCLLILGSITCEKIEVPEICSDSTAFSVRYFGYHDFKRCPGFDLFMETNSFKKDGQDIVEYRSEVNCSTNNLPYEYLLDMKSNRNSLAFTDCQLPEHGSFGDGWPKLEYLEFENYGEIEPLKREHFGGLDNLQSLKLSINSSLGIPDDLFSGLTKLRDLSLKVECVNTNLLKNLTRLETLSLSISSAECLNNFDTSEMKDLPAIKKFVLFDTNFKRLSKRVFEGFGNVEYVLLDHNKIEAIDADAFEPLTSVKSIVSLFNELTSIPAGLFSRNLKLEIIDITSSGLTSISPGLFSNLPNLREVQILWNSLTSIPSDLIHGSTNLERLDLRFNKITSLPRDLLQNHSKLAEIRLAGNSIPSTSSDLFDDKSPITEVSFNY